MYICEECVKKDYENSYFPSCLAICDACKEMKICLHLDFLYVRKKKHISTNKTIDRSDINQEILLDGMYSVVLLSYDDVFAKIRNTVGENCGSWYVALDRVKKK